MYRTLQERLFVWLDTLEIVCMRAIKNWTSCQYLKRHESYKADYMIFMNSLKTYLILEHI
jgi:hypothetical protein